jgi:hypothetical protein
LVEYPAVKKGMKVDIELKRYEKDKRRVYIHTEAFKEKKNLRPAIEGTISAMKRTGLNTIRVHGYNYLLKKLFFLFSVLQQ